MTEPAGHPAPPPRTWRPMAAGTAGILLALGLAWFVGAVVVPVWKTRKVLGECDSSALTNEEAIVKLGGKEQALRRLSLYLDMPDWVAPRRHGAVVLLGKCGEQAVPVLKRSLKSKSPEVRLNAVFGLALMNFEQPPRPSLPQEIVPVLLMALEDDSGKVRAAAATTLGDIGPNAGSAILALEKMLGDKDPDAAYSAKAALRHIRGSEAGK